MIPGPMATGEIATYTEHCFRTHTSFWKTSPQIPTLQDSTTSWCYNWVFSRPLHILWPFREVCPHTSAPDHFVSNFLILIFSIVLTIQSNHWPQLINPYRLLPLTMSSSKQSEQPGTVFKVLPTGKIFLHYYPLYQKGAGMLQLSTFDVYIMQNYVSQAWIFFSSVNWA